MDSEERSQGGPCEVPIEERAQKLRDHYERVSSMAGEWANQIPVAINEWEQKRTMQSEALFQRGEHQLHSGGSSRWLIDVDALSDESIEAAAEWLASLLPPFGSVVGIPEGGLRLAKAMEKHATEGPVLIVDDVLTTGASMETEREGHEIGAVLFARGPCPEWVTPLFELGAPQGEVEPVAWMTLDNRGRPANVFLSLPPNDRVEYEGLGYTCVPLYRHPPEVEGLEDAKEDKLRAVILWGLEAWERRLREIEMDEQRRWSESGGVVIPRLVKARMEHRDELVRRLLQSQGG